MLFYVQDINQIPKALFDENIEYFSISFGVPIRATHDADFSDADHLSLPSGLNCFLIRVQTRTANTEQDPSWIAR